MTSRPKWIEEILLDDYMLRETPEQSQEDLAIIRSVEQTILHDRDQSRDDIVYSNYANFIYGYQWSGYKEELDDQL
ncbi:MAG: hypothetical protein KDK51_02330 [Deltaproteobacteria bacterium]|nr:hypothetical protein [Deltaproteobacteria bacterium]